MPVGRVPVPDHDHVLALQVDEPVAARVGADLVVTADAHPAAGEQSLPLHLPDLVVDVRPSRQRPLQHRADRRVPAVTPDRLWITARDGIRLAADVYLPEEHTSTAVPALLEALPYRKDDLTSSSHLDDYVRLCREGNFAVCRLDVRGTGSSEGRATDEYPPSELDDLADVIAWLAAQPWCNGRVGMFGYSYSGFNSLQAACERPRGSAPMSRDLRHRRPLHRRRPLHGRSAAGDRPRRLLPLHDGVQRAAAGAGGVRRRLARRVAETDRGGRAVAVALDARAARRAVLAARLRPPRLAHRLPDDDRRRLGRRLPERHVSGVRGPRCEKSLLFGPWSHMSPASSLPGPHIDLVPEVVRWFDRWLRDADNGVDGDPPIRVFVRHSTRPEPDLGQLHGEWRAEAGWPLARGRELVLVPEVGVDGRGGSAAGPTTDRDRGVDTLAVRSDVGIAAWISCAGGLPLGPGARPRRRRLVADL